MRLEGCVLCQKRRIVRFRGTSCILYVHKHRLLLLEMMSADAHRMMSANAHRCKCTQMRVLTRHMTLCGSTDLQMSLQISLTRGSRGCASALGIHTLACESCVGKYYISNLFETIHHPYDD